MTKNELRRHFRKIRSELDQTLVETWSQAMARDLVVRLRSRSFDGVLFAFSGLKGEAHLLPYLARERFHIALPKVLPNGEMQFYLWQDGDECTSGPFGIWEPSSHAISVYPQIGDVVVAPALALDSFGYRLGMGGGFYDRWLAEYRSRFSFIAGAVLPPFKMSNELPRETHDIPVDFCLSCEQSV